MARPAISIISSLRNCLALTQEMLSSLRQSEELDHAEIILIDDASTDETPLFLEGLAQDPKIHSITNPTNLGFARSNNRAASTARGDLLVFINNDLCFDQPWLSPMLDLLRTRSMAGLVGNIQRNARTGLIDHAGIFFDLDGMPTHAHKNRARLPSGDYRERSAVTAACMVTSRETFLSAGGFDEGYLNGFEDVDLCVRLKKKGFRHYVSHLSQVRHHVSSSPGRHENNDRNSQRFKELHSDYCRRFGQEEWASGYLNRYARYWWRMNPSLFCKALFLLAQQWKTKKTF